MEIESVGQSSCWRPYQKDISKIPNCSINIEYSLIWRMLDLLGFPGLALYLILGKTAVYELKLLHTAMQQQKSFPWEHGRSSHSQRKAVGFSLEQRPFWTWTGFHCRLARSTL